MMLPHLARCALAFAFACVATLPARAQLRPATPAQAAQDAVAFAPVERLLAGRLTDVESLVVAVRGRIVHEYHRDGAPDRPRNQQSVEKSVVAVMVGIALGQGRLASLDQPVLALMPEWAPLNADPRAAAITLRHLLTMTAGFAAGADAEGRGGRLPPAQGWARPLVAAPGDRFAYDNAIVPMLYALLEKVTGQPALDYGRAQLAEPLAFGEFGRTGSGLHLRTRDMASLGQLLLQDGQWAGRQLLPADFVRAASSVQNSGGPPVGMRYGFMWWIVPGGGPRPPFMASGYAGQVIWVHPELELVVAGTSTVSPASHARAHMVELLTRGGVIEAALRSANAGP